MAKVFKPFEHSGVIDCTGLLKKRGDRVTHGDLVIVFCNKEDLPADFASLKDAPEGVLAEGEHTAHAHQLFHEEAPETPAWKPVVINGDMQVKADVSPFTLKQAAVGEMYMVITAPSLLLKHQEHRPMRLPEGYYQIGIQQEFDPFEQMRRAVLD